MPAVSRLFLTALLCAPTLTSTLACSRFTYTGKDQLVVTGRTLDWMEPLKTDLWAMPVGVERVGAPDGHGLHWRAKYGSIVASGYDMATADGMNTAGLDVNNLYMASTQYPKHVAGQSSLSVYSWGQYILDNYATVDEAVKGFTPLKLNILAPVLPNGSVPTVHLAISDATGDNAVFEYIDGKLVVHHGKQYKVMTNEPRYDQQLALNYYWLSLKGVFLPGTARPEDRYVRASYYLSQAPETADVKKAVATVFSIVHNISTPFSVDLDPKHPNIAPTRWSSVADLKHKVYYFQQTNQPNTFWINMSKLDLGAGAKIKRLPLQGGQIYSGDVADQFEPSTPLLAGSKN